MLFVSVFEEADDRERERIFRSGFCTTFFTELLDFTFPFLAQETNKMKNWMWVLVRTIENTT